MANKMETTIYWAYIVVCHIVYYMEYNLVEAYPGSAKP